MLYSCEDIAARNAAIAREIAGLDLSNLLIVAILKGSFVFASDLLRALYEAGVSPEVDFMSLSSYGAGTTSRGQVTILRDVEMDMHGRSVILVDDILESGRTLAFAKDLMVARGARSVHSCVLLDKPGHRSADIEADFVGFECPDLFVVGYGMDVAHAFRELPFVGIVEERSDRK
ncbi:Hypoxanthine-guanine phosphoribosyltransferase [Lutibaculum baratangense AMV1]|uniref:Hypoxanthine phosphoribosyltransferase n=1 Tax=Lutibaculum baratangense AMV1 TaxID=631454 RepID=V4QW13_9HYPH|nr:Hypoxanthine-guanine phosphoribosyltransferase [Lutibaculum baratangense AMV1]